METISTEFDVVEMCKSQVTKMQGSLSNVQAGSNQTCKCIKLSINTQKISKLLCYYHGPWSSKCLQPIIA